MNDLKAKHRATIEERARKSFPVFHLLLASQGIRAVEGDFQTGDHIEEFCRRLQNNPETVTMAFRNASKSVTLRSFIMWQLFRSERAYEEISYFSYKQDFAGYHLNKAKRYIEHCDCFKEFKSLTEAESILRYETPAGNTWECYPEGILAFKRGLHRDGVVLDDILRDATVSLDLSQIEKITRIVREEVLSIPKKGGWLHLAGTPQDETDIFGQLKHEPTFDYAEYPAEITRNGERIATWPEVFPIEELDKRKSKVGGRAYQKEYLLIPVRSTKAYFTREDIETLIDPDLKNLKPGGKQKDYGLEDVEVYGGMDLGKKRHPSHLTLFAKREGKDKDGNPVNRYEQIVSRWFDGVQYIDQLAWAKAATESFGVIRLKYDNTRAEFEALDEMKEVPRAMEAVTMTRAGNFQAASALSRVVEKGEIRFLDDDRQLRQICIVDNDLKAPETAEGHGDAFFSNSLAIQAATEETPKMSIIF